MEHYSLTLDISDAPDRIHLAASRAAALTYAGVIESEKPQLAKEIRDVIISIDPANDVKIGDRPTDDRPPPSFQVSDFKCPNHGIIKPEDVMTIPALGTFCGRCYRDLFNDKEKLLQLLVKVEPV